MQALADEKMDDVASVQDPVLSPAPNGSRTTKAVPSAAGLPSPSSMAMALFRQGSHDSTAGDSLQDISSWIRSIPPDDVAIVQHMREYRDFVRCFEALRNAHSKVLAWSSNGNIKSSDTCCGRVVSSDLDFDQPMAEPMTPLKSTTNETSVALCNTPSSSLATPVPTATSLSFLQFVADNHVVLRILDFLECASLCRVHQTCTRFCELSLRSAWQRTRRMAARRQLPNVLQLLRAQEHVYGQALESSFPHVRVPTLLLRRRVRVSDSGDPDYNGIFCCTGSNGNGFVFTKARDPELRLEQRNRSRTNGSANIMNIVDEDDNDGDSDPEITDYHDAVSSSTSSSTSPSSFRRLRCIIAKRFSNETLLWYCSKEVIAMENDGSTVRTGDLTQRYSFWARLSQLGDASPDLCRYPSQSSVLSRHGEGWQTLSTTRHTHPPTVELID